MGLMAWLFPNVELARQRALAQITAGRCQMDEIDALEQPIRDLARDVMPLLREVEMAGLRPAMILVPIDRLRTIRLASIQVAVLRGTRLSIAGAPVDCLFGVPIHEGAELAVISQNSPA